MGVSVGDVMVNPETSDVKRQRSSVKRRMSGVKGLRRADAIRILGDHRDELRSEFGVKSLALFGSVARDEANPASDIDLLVEFSHPIGLLHLTGTSQYIEKLLQAKRVDLILRRAVLPELREAILAEAVDVF
jgi:predicted nucleotidyltransferase